MLYNIYAVWLFIPLFNKTSLQNRSLDIFNGVILHSVSLLLVYICMYIYKPGLTMLLLMFQFSFIHLSKLCEIAVYLMYTNE